MAGPSNRLAYLDAMGIRAWVPRQGSAQAEEIPESLAPEPTPRPTPEPAPAPVTLPVTPVEATAPARRAKAPAKPPELKVVRNDGEPVEWTSFREEVAGCRQCTLCESRTQTVFGVGDKQARWLVVGEAPGVDEDQQGEPFVGPTGQLLSAMLKAAGHTREQVFITNVLKCRPPENRDPHKDELAACSSYLVRQIELIKPSLILAVGRVAAHHLLETDIPVGRLRGIRHVHAATSIPVVVTYHPAYLMRKPSEKRKSWDDLRLAMSCSEPAS